MIKEYIENQDESLRIKLSELYKVIVSNLPAGYVEKMSYGMPTFWYLENIIHFAAYKHHIGIYPAPEGINNFKDQLSKYKTSKGTIKIPLDQDIPLDLIAEIVKYRIKQLNIK